MLYTEWLVFPLLLLFVCSFYSFSISSPFGKRPYSSNSRYKWGFDREKVEENGFYPTISIEPQRLCGHFKFEKLELNTFEVVFLDCFSARVEFAFQTRNQIAHHFIRSCAQMTGASWKSEKKWRWWKSFRQRERGFYQCRSMICAFRLDMTIWAHEQ